VSSSIKSKRTRVYGLSTGDYLWEEEMPAFQGIYRMEGRTRGESVPAKGVMGNQQTGRAGWCGELKQDVFDTDIVYTYGNWHARLVLAPSDSVH